MEINTYSDEYGEVVDAVCEIIREYGYEVKVNTRVCEDRYIVKIKIIGDGVVGKVVITFGPYSFDINVDCKDEISDSIREMIDERIDKILGVSYDG